MKRRHLLIGGGIALVAAALPWRRVVSHGPGVLGRFGPLKKDPNGILDLPDRFSYTVLQRMGDRMTDAELVPGAFDGMGCFPTQNRTLTLMRNHELDGVEMPSPYIRRHKPPREAFDPEALGGVTRVVLDATSLRVLSSNLVLAGTVRNCAGGVSPWGWLSCEETTAPGHGYVFQCDVGTPKVLRPRQLKALGRFRHEAAVVDPTTQIIYLTEDQPDGALYRFVPVSKETLTPAPGKLQALVRRSSPRFDTATQMVPGDAFDVDWVDIREPDPKDDDVRLQAREQGAALVRRGEGMWFDARSVWFTSTSGGPASAGQVFRLDLGDASKLDRLHLVAHSTTTQELDMPDNITIAPWGEVYLCEDSVMGDQYIRTVSAEGRVGDFARNALSQSELAGACFSPDGRTLFVNIYTDGLTLAVRGPFDGA